MFEFKGDLWEYRKRSCHRNELKIGSEVGAGLVQRWVAEFPPFSSILDCKTLQTAIIRRFQLRERQYTTFQVKRCPF